MAEYRKYSKFIVALIGVILTGLNVTYGNNPTVELLIGLAAAAGVYSVPNKPGV